MLNEIHQTVRFCTNLRMSQLVHGGFSDVNVVKLVDGQGVRGVLADRAQIRVS